MSPHDADLLGALLCGFVAVMCYVVTAPGRRKEREYEHHVTAMFAMIREREVLVVPDGDLRTALRNGTLEDVLADWGARQERELVAEAERLVRGEAL